MAATAHPTYLDSELELASLETARFSWAGGDYRSRPSLGMERVEQLSILEAGHAHDAYGHELFEAAFPKGSELREGLREALLAAEREKSRLRFRLRLATDLPEWVHSLYWELLADPDRHLVLARSPDTAFSRYLDVRRLQGPPVRERPRLLCVVSAPWDVARFHMAEIRRGEVISSLEDSLRPLGDDVEVAFLEPPSTLARLRERLMERGGFQLLHFFGHGQRRNGASSLVLENENGRAHHVEEKLLSEVFLGVHELRLVTLVACHGGAPSSHDPFSGLAGRLVQRGVPAVIAMRREVSIETARLFTKHLYASIAQTGRVDAAVNESRQQLYLAQPQRIVWSSPVLYSRLNDGRLWLPREEDPESGKPSVEARGPLRQSLPWISALFVLVLLVLVFRSATSNKARLQIQVSQIVIWLMRSAVVIKQIDFVDLAAGGLGGLRLPILGISSPSAQARDHWPQKFPQDDGKLVLQTTAAAPSLEPVTKVDRDGHYENFFRPEAADADPEPDAVQNDKTSKPLDPQAANSERPERSSPVSRDGSIEIAPQVVRVAPVNVADPPIEDTDFADYSSLYARNTDTRSELYQHQKRAELLVARITAENSDGAGILFNIDDHYAYGITAKHVVFQHGKMIEGLKAELRAWPGRQLPVEVSRLDHEEDLAVFRADLALLGLSRAKLLEAIPLNQLGSSKSLRPGTALFSLVHSPDNAWITPKQPVRFVRIVGANAFLFELGCPRGHSGGAVFDEHWRLVGMMIDSEPPFCRAFRIDPILKIIQGWKLEIGLSPPPAPNRETAASRQTTVAVIGFDNRSNKNLPNLGNLAQNITTSYLNTLPGVVLITRDRLNKVSNEIRLPDSIQTSMGISKVGHLLQADALVAGSIVRYDVERRPWKGFRTTALEDVFRMALNLQILDVETGRVQFSKNFDVERTKQYPKADSAPSQPIDLTSELLSALLEQAQPDLRSALSQVVRGFGKAGQFIDVAVNSTPAGADIILGGIYMGKTPKTLQLGLDIHEIQIVLHGYEPWVRRFRAEPGKGIDATLVPKSN